MQVGVHRTDKWPTQSWAGLLKTGHWYFNDEQKLVWWEWNNIKDGRVCAKSPNQDHDLFGYHAQLNIQNHVIALILPIISSPKLHFQDLLKNSLILFQLFLEKWVKMFLYPSPSYHNLSTNPQQWPPSLVSLCLVLPSYSLVSIKQPRCFSFLK